MELSIFIAKIFAITYLAIGLGMLFNGAYYTKAMKSMIRDTGVMYLGGIMALIIGFLMITYHNFWVSDWTVIITALGWLAFVKGLALLMFPKNMVDISSSMLKNGTTTISIIALVLGLILGYFGFGDILGLLG